MGENASFESFENPPMGSTWARAREKKVKTGLDNQQKGTLV